jgi:hypothetical protein
VVGRWRVAVGGKGECGSDHGTVNRPYVGRDETAVWGGEERVLESLALVGRPEDESTREGERGEFQWRA